MLTAQSESMQQDPRITITSTFTWSPSLEHIIISKEIQDKFMIGIFLLESIFSKSAILTLRKFQ